MYLEVTSKENKYYKELKKITNKKSDRIFIEGKKLFIEAVNSDLEIKQVYFDKSNYELFSSLLSKIPNGEKIFMNNNLLASLFTTETKPDSDDLIVALAKSPDFKLDDLLKERKNLIFLERIQDPGNLGTIIRSALAFNSGGIILSKDSVDPFNTKVIRASAGAVFKLPMVIAGKAELIQLRNEQYQLIATSSRSNGCINLSKQDLKSPLVVMFGNEGSGLSYELIEIADKKVTIPHSTNVESLNIGVAVSVFLWELNSKG